VEVVYGPSVLLGRNALGASVNLVTRRGASPAARELEASAGSWGRYELKARAGARHGVWDYYVGARYEREGGWREDTRSRIGTLFAKLGVLNGSWDATLSYSARTTGFSRRAASPRAWRRPIRGVTSPGATTSLRGQPRHPQRPASGRPHAARHQRVGRSLSSEQFNANFVGEDSRQRNATRIGGGAVQLSGKLPLGARGAALARRCRRGLRARAVHIFAVRAAAPPIRSRSRCVPIR